MARTKPLFGFAPSPLKIKRKARITSTTANTTPTIRFEVLLSAFVSWVSVCWVIVPPPVNHADLIDKKKPSPTEYATQHDDANPGIRRLEYPLPARCAYSPESDSLPPQLRQLQAKCG